MTEILYLADSFLVRHPEGGSSQLACHPERSEGSVVDGQILRRLPLADSSE
jgi:hypothetical protein